MQCYNENLKTWMTIQKQKLFAPCCDLHVEWTCYGRIDTDIEVNVFVET